MKLLISGDWHLTDKTPINRIDNYWGTCKRKITFILETAKREKVDYILQPGDFTDSPSMSWSSFIELIDLFNKYRDIKILTVYGQHDLRYRIKGNTALDAIATSCKNIEIESVTVCSVSYNNAIPDKAKESSDILLIHGMILQEKIWSGQEEYSDAVSFLRSNKFHLVVSGDNHQPFIVDSKVMKKHLFNCGALMRNKIDQIDHKPFIILFNTDTKEYEKIMIPIEPAEKVFNIEKAVREKEKNENLDAFISGLSEHKEVGLKFEDNLNSYLDENNIEQPIRNIIEEAKQ